MPAKSLRAWAVKSWSHSSASQVKTFKRCPRKWWFEKIQDEVPIVHTDKQLSTFQYGTDVHEAIELYLYDRPAPMLQTCAHAAATLDYLDEIKPGVLGIEIGITIETRHSDVKVIGFADVVHEQGIIDHKTTSSPRWALSGRQLRQDPQIAGIYLYWWFSNNFRYPNPSALGTLNYIQKPVSGKAPNNWQVTEEFTYDAVARNYDKILDIIDLQRAYSKMQKPEDVPCNTGACGDFGGCPWLPICPEHVKRRSEYNSALQKG